MCGETSLVTRVSHYTIASMVINFLRREKNNSHPVVYSQITKFMGPTWGPPGSCRPQMGPMLAPWTLLAGFVLKIRWGLRMGRRRGFFQGLYVYSLSGTTPYRKIPWSLEAARFRFRLFQSLWHLTGTSAASRGWGLGDSLRRWLPSGMWAGPLIFLLPPPGVPEWSHLLKFGVMCCMLSTFHVSSRIVANISGPSLLISQ